MDEGVLVGRGQLAVGRSYRQLPTANCQLPPMMSMMPRMMMMSRAARVLHAVADRRADDHSRRAEQRAGGCADRRSSGPAAMFRPVVAEGARGRQEQRRAEHGCRDAFMNQGCHSVTSCRYILRGEYQCRSAVNCDTSSS